MKPAVFDPRQVPELGPGHWTRLSMPFSEGRELMPHEIANYAGVDRARARALMFALADRKFVELWLLVYHTCDEARVALWLLSAGPPSYPWTCPNCSEAVPDERDLRFGLACVPRRPIRFASDAP